LISGLIGVFGDMRNTLEIIGIETLGANAMEQSLKIGHNTALEKIDTFADGVAVKRV
jgi:threonine dehydratase